MEIKFYAPRWGSEDIPWEDFAKIVAENDFRGIEVYPLQTLHEKSVLLQTIEDNNLEFALIHAEMKEGKDFERYKNALKRNIYTLAEFQTNGLKPQFINSQTGREYYSKSQMSECFTICDEISAEIGIPIIHETHRNKWSFAAHIVKEYLQEFPSIKLALDLSHWVCVSESYLQDQEDAVDLAINHAVHLHARVGHPEGPQVTDPRATENAVALAFHLNWWDKWVKLQKEKNVDSCTITTEFGPYPYMIYKCFSNEPVANQWEVNLYMKDLLTKRFENL